MRAIIIKYLGTNASGPILFFLLKNVLMILFGINKIKKLFSEFKEFYEKKHHKEEIYSNQMEIIEI